MRGAASRRAKGQCEWIGCISKNKVFNADHIVSRKYNSTFWDLDNIIWLHSHCHLQRKRQDALGWTDSVYAARGKDTVVELRMKAKQYCKKPSIIELYVMEQKFNEMYQDDLQTGTKSDDNASIFIEDET